MRLIPVYALAAVLLHVDSAFASRCGYRGSPMSVKSDLRNLASQQEQFHHDSARYSASLTALGFQASEGVTITTQLTGTGYVGRGTHAGISGLCMIYVGLRPATFPATATAGEPFCVFEVPQTRREPSVNSDLLLWYALLILTLWLVTKRFLAHGRGAWWARRGIALIAVLYAVWIAIPVPYECPPLPPDLTVPTVLATLAMGVFALAWLVQIRRSSS